jgi:Tfp pilus assembly protein PilN
MSVSPETAAPPRPALDEVVLVPAESFFVRRVPVDASADVAGQVELSLEASAPFSVSQLFSGFMQAQGQPQALVFATHRRLFAPEAWEGAAAVLPAFAALLGEPPAGRRIRLWQTAEAWVAAAWDGESTLPALVLGRAGNDEATRDVLLADVRARLSVDTDVEEFSGSSDPRLLRSGAVELTLEGGGGRRLVTRLEPAEIETMDVRDKAVLAGRKQVEQRNRLLWRTLLAGFAVLAIAVALELGMAAARTKIARQQEAVRQVAPEVEKIQTAQALGARIEEMSRRRLRPFEMLAVLNQARPPGVQFTRSVTNGQGAIEIEAQTANADSVGTFEAALRALPAIETIEVRDLRLREGVTTFMLMASFREGSLATVAGSGGNGGASPATGGSR